MIFSGFSMNYDITNHPSAGILYTIQALIAIKAKQNVKGQLNLLGCRKYTYMVYGLWIGIPYPTGSDASILQSVILNPGRFAHDYNQLLIFFIVTFNQASRVLRYGSVCQVFRLYFCLVAHEIMLFWAIMKQALICHYSQFSSWYYPTARLCKFEMKGKMIVIIAD